MYSLILLATFHAILLNIAHGENQCKVFLPNPDYPIENETSINATARIVNGHVAQKSTNKFLVSFHEFQGSSVSSSFCTGSLIAPNWILTAAHCEISKEKHVVSLGGAKSVDGTFRKIELVRSHTEFGAESNPLREILDDDIAVVKITTPAPENMTPVKLNSATNVPKPGRYARVSGYGTTNSESKNTGVSRSVDVPVKSSARCAVLFASTVWQGASTGAKIKDKLQFCAGYEDGHCDSCQGDSGGPLFLYDSNNYPVQIGITSFGIGCGRKKRPGIYARVSAYIEWIRINTDNDPKIVTSTDGQEFKGDGDEQSFLDKINPLCFPETGIVQLKSGQMKRMNEIVIGDEVLTSKGEYSPVFMFTHRMSDVVEKFIRLQFHQGSVTLSAGHYLFINGELKTAREAIHGDVLSLDDGTNAKIQNIEMVNGKGLYNPQTVIGTIVVDGVQASTYTTAVPPLTAHSLLRPFSALFKAFELDATFGFFDRITFSR